MRPCWSSSILTVYCPPDSAPNPRPGERCEIAMKTQRAQAPEAQRLTELRRREEQVNAEPSAEAYLELADQYHALGLHKESDRLLQLAEGLEQGPPVEEPRPVQGLLSGAANPVMLIEVIQILSRTKLNGEFI